MSSVLAIWCRQNFRNEARYYAFSKFNFNSSIVVMNFQCSIIYFAFALQSLREKETRGKLLLKNHRKLWYHRIGMSQTREWCRRWWTSSTSSTSVNKYDSELYYARRSPSRAVTRVGITAVATREPISMVISRRPIIEYAKYVYAR